MVDFEIGQAQTRPVGVTDTLRERVALRMDGDDWAAWSGVSIRLGLKHTARSAALSLSATNPREQRLLRIEPEMACQVRIGDEPVLTGFTDSDDFNPKEGSKFTVAARSATKDIVDCSVDHSSGVFKSMKVEQITRALCKAYGFSNDDVICNVNTGDALPLFRATGKEKVLAALDRMGRERALLFVDDGLGRLRILQINDAAASVRTLRRGRDYTELARHRSSVERHSEYRVLGQTATEIDAVGTSRDAWMARRNRHRLLILDAEKSASSAECRRRALFEAAVRAGRSVTFTIEIPGWRIDPTDPTSPLWDGGMKVRLQDEVWEIDDDLMIGEVEFRRSTSTGTTTSLSVGPASGFMVEPPKRRAGAKKSPALMDWFEEDDGGDGEGE